MDALVTPPKHEDITLATSRTTSTMERHCGVCFGSTIITVDRDRYNTWCNGELIQRVWPELSPSMREQMITGTHKACWDAMFADDED